MSSYCGCNPFSCSLFAAALLNVRVSALQPLVAVYEHHSADQHQSQDNQHRYKCDAYWIYIEVIPLSAGWLPCGWRCLGVCSGNVRRRIDDEAWCRESGRWTRAIDYSHLIPLKALKIGRRVTLSAHVAELANGPGYNGLEFAVANKRIETEEQSLQVHQWSYDLDIKSRKLVFTQIQRDQFVLESE